MWRKVPTAGMHKKYFKQVVFQKTAQKALHNSRWFRIILKILPFLSDGKHKKTLTKTIEQCNNSHLCANNVTRCKGMKYNSVYSNTNKERGVQKTQSAKRVIFFPIK